jgi:hypothetical protein
VLGYSPPRFLTQDSKLGCALAPIAEVAEIEDGNMPDVRRLPVLICPQCDEFMTERQCIGTIPTATSFEDCLRRCERHNIGASNTQNGTATYIYRDPLQNIPDASREGAIEALMNALNELNRPSKVRRFGFSTSEDAVTWVVFTHLLRSDQLVAALKGAGVSRTSPKRRRT